MRLLRAIRARFSGPRDRPAPAPGFVIAGLGNPGPRYEATRHNVGFRVVEKLAHRFGGNWQEDSDLEARTCRVEIADRTCLLVEPLTFMNRSGSSLGRVFARWPELEPTKDLLVVEDDLDLPIGRIRLRPGGGAGGHRGLGDILDVLGTKAISRLRFGIGHPGASTTVIDWVLEPFSPEDEAARLPAALERAADAVEMTVREGLVPAMGRFNAEP